MSAEAWLKLALLSNGISVSPEFSAWFADTAGYVRRRNFYNSPNWSSTDDVTPPQELLLAGDRPVIVAVNNYGRPAWRLSWSAESGPVVVSQDGDRSHPVELISDLAAVRTDNAISRLCNLYGGSALAFFSPRACYFFADGTECGFCSLNGTARENDEFAARLTAVDVGDAVKAVVAEHPDEVNQIMIVGGNERDLNRGFRNQVKLVRAASLSLEQAGLADKISVHLVAMPPRDLSIIHELEDVPNVHVGFNLEVWDARRFSEVAPGKHADYTQSEILKALEYLRDVVGHYRAHSILIAGLETPHSTLAGAAALASSGISPIINAYHSDRHSSLGLSIRPTYRQLAEVAAGLQELHDTYPIKPYWKGCGRNALDYEAANGMFRSAAPELN